jgi:hypothetical protein
MLHLGSSLGEVRTIEAEAFGTSEAGSRETMMLISPCSPSSTGATPTFESASKTASRSFSQLAKIEHVGERWSVEQNVATAYS